MKVNEYLVYSSLCRLGELYTLPLIVAETYATGIRDCMLPSTNVVSLGGMVRIHKKSKLSKMNKLGLIYKAMEIHMSCGNV
jgi:hypothetical protein